jgi:hypothetical protein
MVSCADEYTAKPRARATVTPLEFLSVTLPEESGEVEVKKTGTQSPGKAVAGEVIDPGVSARAKAVGTRMAIARKSAKGEKSTRAKGEKVARA